MEFDEDWVVGQYDFHRRSLKNAAMFRQGSNATSGALFLKIATMITASGYVQTAETKMYALSVEPLSKAMPVIRETDRGYCS